MGKKLAGVTWRSVALEGIPLDGPALDGFVALEECTDYHLDNNKFETKTKDKKELKEKKSIKDVSPTLKRKSQKILEKSHKRFKLSSGFIVEDCSEPKPSNGSNCKNNDGGPKNSNKPIKLCDGKVKIEHEKNKKNEELPGNHQNKKKGKTQNKQRTKDSDTTEEQSKFNLEDMTAWTPYHVPEEILKALADQGFIKPTKIQELCLPPALLGRRDILGAAETGSGKTLAFGIPILAGIMKLKEQEESGVDIYNLKFKKNSTRQEPTKTSTKPEKNFKQKHKQIINNNDNIKKEGISAKKDQIIDDVESNVSTGNSDSEEDSGNDSDDSKNDNTVETDDENFDIEKEDNSDDDENYIHLSDMIESDDLADSSDEENDTLVNPNDSDNENDAESDSDDSVSDDDDNADIGQGMGCVKVIENIDLPKPHTVKSGKPLYALVIAPTRELALQISKHITSAAKYTGVRVATLVGGMAQVKQERLLSRSPEIVVCTPGRLWELLQQGNEHLAKIDSIKFLAIDETDRMVERNHFDELRPLLERINADESSRSGRQNFVMSATLTMTHELPAHMKGKKVTKRGKIINKKVQKMTPQQKIKKLITMIGMTDPKIVDLTVDNLGKSGTLTECKISCALDQKDCYLYYILRSHPGRAIVFCNSIGCVKRLAQLFTLLKCKPLPLHAAMPQRQRIKNLERFAADPNGVMVATDVAARGLDIPNVDHVVHYQVPRTAENYVHRSGRTARASKEGLTILMMEPGEAFLYAKLCRTLNKTLDIPTLEVPERVLGGVRRCVSLAREVEAAALRGKRRAQETGWLERAARECEIVVDEDFVPMKKKLEDQNGDYTAKELQAKKKQLEQLLSSPMFPAGFSFKYPTLNDPSALITKGESALDAVKKSLESGEAKKERRKSKNASLLNLQKQVQSKSQHAKKGPRAVKKKFFKK